MLDFAIPEDIRLRNREFTATTCKVALTFQLYARLCVDDLSLRFLQHLGFVERGLTPVEIFGTFSPNITL